VKITAKAPRKSRRGQPSESTAPVYDTTRHSPIEVRRGRRGDAYHCCMNHSKSSANAPVNSSRPVLDSPMPSSWEVLLYGQARSTQSIEGQRLRVPRLMPRP